MTNFKIEAYLEYIYEDSTYQSLDTFFISSSEKIDFNYINNLVKNRNKNFDSVDIILSKINSNEPLK